MKRVIRCSNTSIIDYRGYQFHLQPNGDYLIYDVDGNYLTDESMSVGECYREVDNWLNKKSDLENYIPEDASKSESKPKHRYEYFGDVYIDGRCIESIRETTWAVSRAKALNNIRFRLRKQHHTNDIVLDDKNLKEI
jgi:hypothetical protein